MSLKTMLKMSIRLQWVNNWLNLKDAMKEVRFDRTIVFCTFYFMFMHEEITCDCKIAQDSLSDRFEVLPKHSKLFSFSYDFKQYEENKLNVYLMKSCKNLEIALLDKFKSDIGGDELFAKFSIIVSTILKTGRITHVLDLLNAVIERNMENVLPSFFNASRICCRSQYQYQRANESSQNSKSSKVITFRVYHRNSMKSERLNDLAVISTEHK